MCRGRVPPPTCGSMSLVPLASFVGFSLWVAVSGTVGRSVGYTSAHSQVVESWHLCVDYLAVCLVWSMCSPSSPAVPPSGHVSAAPALRAMLQLAIASARVLGRPTSEDRPACAPAAGCKRQGAAARSALGVLVRLPRPRHARGSHSMLLCVRVAIDRLFEPSGRFGVCHSRCSLACRIGRVVYLGSRRKHLGEAMVVAEVDVGAPSHVARLLILRVSQRRAGARLLC